MNRLLLEAPDSARHLDEQATPGLREDPVRKVLHIQAEDRVRRLAAIRASEQGVTVSEYVATLVEADAVASGLLHYLENNQNREEACGE